MHWGYSDIARKGNHSSFLTPTGVMVKLHLFNLLWICCGLVVDLLYNISTCCGFSMSQSELRPPKCFITFYGCCCISKDSKDTFTISAQWNFPKNLEALTHKPLYWQLCVAEESTKLWWQGLWLYGIDHQKPIMVNFVNSACETVQTTCLCLNGVVLQGLQ